MCVRRRSLGDRVEPAVVPRVATPDPAHREPGAAACAVQRRRIEGVLRAGRVESATRAAVPADQPPPRIGAMSTAAGTVGCAASPSSSPRLPGLARPLTDAVSSSAKGSSTAPAPAPEEVDAARREVVGHAGDDRRRRRRMRLRFTPNLPVSPRHTDARGIAEPSWTNRQRDRTGPVPAGPCEGLEACTVANAPDQAERRFRPRTATRAQHCAPPARPHPGAEAVSLAALASIGLEGALQTNRPPRGGPARNRKGATREATNDSV